MIAAALRALGLRLDVIDDGRAHLRRIDRGRKLLGLEWSLGRMPSSVGVSLDVSDAPDATASVRLPGASLYVTIPVARAVHDRLVAMARDVGAERWDGVDVACVSVHDRALWWSFLHPQSSWQSRTPRWRNGSFRPLDALLGSHAYSSEQIEEREVQIPMPEGTYDWTIKLSRDTWRRPRWPWPIIRVHASADAKDGEQIPVPGKGENAWDCGADAVYGLATSAATIEDAIASVVGSVLRTRRNRDGSHIYVEGGKYDTRSEAA